LDRVSYTNINTPIEIMDVVMFVEHQTETGTEISLER